MGAAFASRMWGGMIDTAADELQRERRKPKHRSNVMLAATILVRGLSAHVRIRNLSETGALVEGSAIPEVGTKLTLCRNQFEAEASVVWAKQGRCGLQFDAPVVVTDWVVSQTARPCTGMTPAQQRIDQIQADIRAGIAPPPEAAAPVAASAAAEREGVLPQRLAEEIAYVQRLIESVGDELIGEPLIVHRHAGALQKFDAVDQILGHLAAVLKAGDRVRAVEAVGMEELRSRLLRRI